MSALTDALQAALQQAQEQEAEIEALKAEIQHPTGPEVQVILDELMDLAQEYMDTPNGQDADEQEALSAFLAEQRPSLEE